MSTVSSGGGIPRNPAPLSQLHEPTKDGQPDENTNENCGETSFAWVVRDIGNEPSCDGDEIHDEVIGQGVVGGSDLLEPGTTHLNPKYVAAAAKRGVALSVFFGTQQQLVAKCHEAMNLPAGDVLANFGGGSNYLHEFSDPAHYNGWGHICAVAHSVAGGLILMDPWIGAYRTYSDAQLERMIVWGYIVVATPAPVAAVPVTTTTTGGATVTNTAGSATPFYGLDYTADAQVWHCPSTGYDVGHGFLALYQGVKGPQGQVATQILGLPKSNEYARGSLTVQDFERGRLVYDATKSDPWMITFDTVINDLEAGAAAAQVATLKSQLSAAQSNLQTAQQQRDALSAQLTVAKSDLAAANTTITQLQQKLAAVQTAQQPAPAPTPAPTPVSTPAPTTPAAAAALLVELTYAEALATLKAASAPTAG